jgi:hypothetical protein
MLRRFYGCMDYIKAELVVAVGYESLDIFAYVAR